MFRGATFITLFALYYVHTIQALPISRLHEGETDETTLQPETSTQEVAVVDAAKVDSTAIDTLKDGGVRVKRQGGGCGCCGCGCCGGGGGGGCGCCCCRPQCCCRRCCTCCKTCCCTRCCTCCRPCCCGCGCGCCGCGGGGRKRRSIQQLRIAELNRREGIQKSRRGENC